MIHGLDIGRWSRLRVVGIGLHGYMLSNGSAEVLLPRRLAGRELQIGEEVDAFCHLDSQDRPIATLRTPAAVAGEIANMRCAAAGRFGAFMEWGLDKDLLVPHKEQRGPLRPGDSAPILVKLDEASGRLVGTTRVEKALLPAAGQVSARQPVDYCLFHVGAASAFAVVENRFWGVFFGDEVPATATPGLAGRAFVKALLPDGKTSLSLSPQGIEAIRSEGASLLAKLREAGGRLALSDRSDPAAIRELAGMSKGSFKKLIGMLMKEGLIVIERDAIRLP